MKNAGSQNGISASVLKNISQMLQLTGAAAGNDRDFHRAGNRPIELQIIAHASAIGIHTSKENFASAALGSLNDPIDGVAFRRLATAMRIDPPFPGTISFRIHRHDDTLGAKSVSRFVDQFGSLES